MMVKLHLISARNLISAKSHGISLDVAALGEILEQHIIKKSCANKNDPDREIIQLLEEDLKKIVLNLWPEPADATLIELQNFAKDALKDLEDGALARLHERFRASRAA